MRYFRLILLFLVMPLSLFSQYYDNGQDPGNIKWLKIETGRFKVIFPESYVEEGKLLTGKLEMAYEEIKGDFNNLDFKIPVIVHNYSTRSNGTVVWAPKRIEIFPSPGEHDMPVDHIEELAIHELTHVFQMVSLEKGFSKAGSYLLGEHFTGFMAGFLPKWYLEGHAVFNESFYGGYGRGNSASFQKPLKALSADEGGVYKYDKLVNGSYKDYVPNHYYSGYQVVTTGLMNYGDDVWNKATEFTAKYPFTLNPVHLSLKKSTGYSKKGIYDFTFENLGKLWEHDLELSGAKIYEPLIEVSTKEYQGYYSPVVVDKDHIAALKSPMTSTIRIVLINRTDSTEKIIFSPGDLYVYELSSADNKIVWVERERDPRWENRDYSIIKILDIPSGKVRKFSSKTRYMSAAISPDGRRIVAVNNSVDNKNSVDILDTETGTILLSLKTPENMFLERPDWSFYSEKITFISLSDAGEGIVTLTLAELNEWDTLKEEGREDLQTAFVSNDTLYYVSSFSGVENGYMESPDGTVRQLTNARFGATDMISDGHSLLFCDYTALGNKVCTVDIQKIPEYKTVKSESYLIDRFATPVKDTSSVSAADYIVKPYRKALSAFNFHSLLPFYVDLDEVTSDYSSIKPGMTLFGQNLLSSVVSWVGLEYHDNILRLHSEIELKGKYPVFKARVDYGGPNTVMGTGGGPSYSDTQPGLNFNGSVSVPLSFSSGRYYQQVVPYFWSNYANSYIDDGDNLIQGYTQLGSRLYFYNYSYRSVRDIYPEFGQFVDILYSWFPFESEYFGDEFTLRSAFFFPGGIKNSGIRLRYEMETQNARLFRMYNRTRSPRGYEGGYSDKVQYLSLDYTVPICYPDFNLGWIFYLKRIRGSLFFDNAFLGSMTRTLLSNTVEWEYINSKGLEIMADFHLFRIPYEISAGVQAIWLKQSKLPVLEAAFSVDIYGTQIGRGMRP